MPANLKKRYAQRLLQFPHAHNKSYLREQAKHPDDVSETTFLHLKKIN